MFLLSHDTVMWFFRSEILTLFTEINGGGEGEKTKYNYWKVRNYQQNTTTFQKFATVECVPIIINA